MDEKQLTKIVEKKYNEFLKKYDTNSNEKTGYSFMDKPWEELYTEEASNYYIAEKTIWQMLVESNIDNLDGIAFMKKEGPVTYGDFFKQVNVFAQAFKSYGINKGDKVAIGLLNCAEMAIMIYALSKIGAIPVLTEANINRDGLVSSLNMTDCKMLITMPPFLENCKNVMDETSVETVVSLSDKDSLPDDSYTDLKTFVTSGMMHPAVSDNEYNPKETAAIVFTSGSTGLPKPVELTNETLNQNFMAIHCSPIAPKRGQTYLGNIPFKSSFGLNSGLHLGLCSGVTIIPLPYYKIDDLPRIVTELKPNLMLMTPYMVISFADYVEQNQKDISYMDMIIYGGDVFEEKEEIAAMEKMSKYGNLVLSGGRGLSEMGGADATRQSDVSNVPGTTGIPHIRNNVLIVDIETGEPLKLGDDKKGLLFETGDTLFNGYYKKPDITESITFVGEDGVRWLNTGDVVSMDERGLIKCYGRLKNDQIKRPDGLKVSLLGVKNVIMSSPHALKCVSVGIPYNEGKKGKRPMSFIVLDKENYEKFEEVHKEISGICHDKLSKRENNLWYVYLSEDAVPYTSATKIDVQKLTEIGEKLAVEHQFIFGQIKDGEIEDFSIKLDDNLKPSFPQKVKTFGIYK